MPLNTLTAISPIDGRYRRVTHLLADYFSEEALIRYRLRVEIEYFIALCRLPLPQLKGVDDTYHESLREISIEKTTNHDVKAVEYFLKECLCRLGLDQYQEFVHFGLTSQDINNTALPLMIKDACTNVFWATVDDTVDQMTTLAHQWKDMAMLARTHGQPASPTTVGKELFVFIDRLKKQRSLLADVPYTAIIWSTIFWG